MKIILNNIFKILVKKLKKSIKMCKITLLVIFLSSHIMFIINIFYFSFLTNTLRILLVGPLNFIPFFSYSDIRTHQLVMKSH